MRSASTNSPCVAKPSSCAARCRSAIISCRRATFGVHRVSNARSTALRVAGTVQYCSTGSASVYFIVTTRRSSSLGGAASAAAASSSARLNADTTPSGTPASCARVSTTLVVSSLSAFWKSDESSDKRSLMALNCARRSSSSATPLRSYSFSVLSMRRASTASASASALSLAAAAASASYTSRRIDCSVSNLSTACIASALAARAAASLDTNIGNVTLASVASARADAASSAASPVGLPVAASKRVNTRRTLS
mmetsp:Transcript_55669/g.136646  ORF Transcript_55669/g.136646 Transcript_55669/m.136646 type:complete len:253 (-) Transcript_55669:239-997(-)